MNRMPRLSCDDIDVRVRDVARARAFYDPFFAALGLTQIHESTPWTVYESPDPAALFVGITSDPQTAPCGTRIAFRAHSHGEVNRVAEVAAVSGATDFEAPHFCPEYSEGYYASFFGDADGNQYEVCYRPSDAGP